MPEPHSSTVAIATGSAIVGWAAGLLGPVLGPYFPIAVFAFLGAYIATSGRSTSSRRQAWNLILSGTVVALVATGLIAHGLALLTPGFTARDWLIPVAFLIGLQPQAAVDKLRALVGMGQAPQRPQQDKEPGSDASDR